MEATNMGKEKSKEQRSRKKFPVECLNKMVGREQEKRVFKNYPLGKFLNISIPEVIMYSE